MTMHCVKCLFSQSKPGSTQGVFTLRSIPGVDLYSMNTYSNKPEITKAAARQTSNISKAARESLPQHKGRDSASLHLQIFFYGGKCSKKEWCIFISMMLMGPMQRL